MVNLGWRGRERGGGEGRRRGGEGVSPSAAALRLLSSPPRGTAAPTSTASTLAQPTQSTHPAGQKIKNKTNQDFPRSLHLSDRAIIEAHDLRDALLAFGFRVGLVVVDERFNPAEGVQRGERLSERLFEEFFGGRPWRGARRRRCGRGVRVCVCVCVCVCVVREVESS